MNYEAKVADLSGAPEVQVEDFDSGSRRTRKRWTIVAVLVLAALLIGAAVALMGGEEESPFPAPDGEQVPTVTVVAPGRSAVAGTINATGTLAARRELPVGVVGEGGRVVSVLVEPGDWVGAGQVLAVIDRSVQTEQAHSSAASVDVAKADAQLAQSNLDRALQLVDRGFISKADVDRLTATRDAARARVKVAEAQYRELLARNARLNIVAPDAGLVLERNVEPAQVVGSGSGVLFSIARGGQMELLANLSESDLSAVTVGSPATVTPVGSGKSFAGQIWQLAPVIDAQNRQGVARIALPYDQAIRPGGFASAQISRGQVIAPRLPESAIQTDDKGSYVFVVNKDSRVERRAVTTGVVTEQGITITSGLSGSEKVVERAGGFLNPGDKVKAVAVNRGNQAPAQ
ncbi:efflux RND transporter periplasmic adaptor subunit [Altererythrobacter sp. Root672]|uniref:efflux RND transporter periplasmic adaptor subunit n=1 Tax=Altererythrobacter sp. Root672 TaxID=1736584 RepID=UPI00070035CC|nr:efflux RND transporter periplasmic adaptor subunit [Altererythrobacter sp. Root672]KRA81497.1 secretion protein HylD [Altererythrobacter sp. Root672]